MKRLPLFLLILIAIAIKSQAQIPNNGFENWTSSGICLQPEGWACINDWMGSTENCYSMSLSSDHYPASVGNYSIKIENTISIWPDYGAGGLVWTGDSTGFGTDGPAFPITGHPTSLCGYYKFLPEFGDTMDIHFAFYKNGFEVTGGRLLSNVLATEWTSFNIPVSDPGYLEADSARIMLSSFFADHMILYGNSVLYVDNLSFDNLISGIGKQDAQNTIFKLYPNPASDIIKLNFSKTCNDKMLLEIYTPAGIMIKSEILKQNQQEINCADLRDGFYMVSIKSKNFSGIQKLVIQR
jgi:hypothetical protein